VRHHRTNPDVPHSGVSIPPSYKVHATDEGNTLMCTTAASNVAGTGVPVTSAGALVPVPHVARCPTATGKLSGAKVGAERWRRFTGTI
jgi:hypothetical protein